MIGGVRAELVEMRSQAQLETLTDVVARHLVRFGSNDQLVLTWTPGA